MAFNIYCYTWSVTYFNCLLPCCSTQLLLCVIIVVLASLVPVCARAINLATSFQKIWLLLRQFNSACVSKCTLQVFKCTCAYIEIWMCLFVDVQTHACSRARLREKGTFWGQRATTGFISQAVNIFVIWRHHNAVFMYITYIFLCNCKTRDKLCSTWQFILVNHRG